MSSTSQVYPGIEWETASPEAVGLKGERLAEAGEWLTHNGEAYRVAVVKSGRMVAKWSRGFDWEQPIACASAAKSVYSSLLGIAIGEGVVAGADTLAAELYPEMLDVPEGTGPKPGRYVSAKDSHITLRQLICNTSGYMKPGEEPGRVLNYQTYGMNVLCHALRNAYAADSCGKLIEQKIRQPIGGSWTWRYTNFDLPDSARTKIFGNYTQIHAGPEDLARLGWLWRNEGRWKSRQVIPAEWIRFATTPVTGVEYESEKVALTYGAGFWTNRNSKLWPGLPTDGFAAYGAGEICAAVFPSLDLVIAQSPGCFEAGDHRSDADGILKRVIDAC